MYNLVATINYPEDTKEYTVPSLSMEALTLVIRDTVKAETTATSFVFTIVPVRA